MKNRLTVEGSAYELIRRLREGAHWYAHMGAAAKAEEFTRGADALAAGAREVQAGMGIYIVTDPGDMVL